MKPKSWLKNLIYDKIEKVTKKVFMICPLIRAKALKQCFSLQLHLFYFCPDCFSMCIGWFSLSGRV